MPLRAFVATLVLLLCAGAAIAGESVRRSPYEPFKFLVGEWNVAAETGKPFAITRFRWGPHQSYIWMSLSTLDEGGEQPHLEGLLVWNGVHKRLDMLLSLDLNGGRVQEQGWLYVDADGIVVREITAFYAEGAQPLGRSAVGADGASARFRQTFKPSGSDRIATSIMRKTATGWAPTFPGGDRLVMTRRRSG